MKRSENVLNEMLEAGFEPNIFVLTSLIQSYGKAKRADDVVKTFDRLLELGITADDRFCSCLLNVMTQLTNVGKLAGCIEKALSLYDKARTEKWRIDAVTFGTVIKLYGVEGNFDGVLNVYEEMKALGVKSSLVIYSTLLDAMGREKRPWQAKSVYRDIVSNGLEPSSSTYSALLRAYCRARYGEDALAIYRDELGDLLCSEAGTILAGLVEAARGTVIVFENAVQSETSRKPIQGERLRARKAFERLLGLKATRTSPSLFHMPPEHLDLVCLAGTRR